MSIEALIQSQTEALLANTEAVKLLTLSLAGRTPTAEKPKADPKPVVKKEEPKVEDKKPDPKVEKSETASDADANANTAAEVLPYETARALVLKLAGAGKRAEIPQVFKAHGIDNLKKLLDKEDDFSTVNDQAKLEAVYADLQKLED